MTQDRSGLAHELQAKADRGTGKVTAVIASMVTEGLCKLLEMLVLGRVRKRFIASCYNQKLRSLL
jgi:hypothetical protein